MAEQVERTDPGVEQAAVPVAAGENVVGEQEAGPADEVQELEIERPQEEPDQPEAEDPAVAESGETDVETAEELPVAEPEAAEPADPEPADPEPVDPEPVDPEPVDPEPVEPESVEPEPAGEPEVLEEAQVAAEVIEPDTEVALPAARRPTGPRRRLVEAMRPKASRGQLLAGLLCAVLGFALVVQVQQTKSEGVSGLRQSELVSILDNVSDEAEQLDHDARDLQATRDKLRSGSDASKAAQDAARSRLDVLGVLAGTLPAAGPGIELNVTDPHHNVQAADLLDALQELRDAGAEAVQIGSVRVVASTSFEDIDNGVQVDQTPLVAPFRFLVIGDPQTLSAALDIPGGVLESLRQRGAVGRVSQSRRLTISALHSLPSPRYARPVPAPSP